MNNNIDRIIAARIPVEINSLTSTGVSRINALKRVLRKFDIRPIYNSAGTSPVPSINDDEGLQAYVKDESNQSYWTSIMDDEAEALPSYEAPKKN